MATMKGKTTAGVPAWDIYVKKNPVFKTVDFEIEHGMSAPLMVKKGPNLSAKKVLPEKTKFHITETKLHKMNKLEFAKVKAGSINGFIQINRIRKPTGIETTTGDEDRALASLDKMIKKNKAPMTIILKNGSTIIGKYKNIVGARTISGTPKADFACYDKAKKNIIFISHKKAGGAASFQQYSGVTAGAGDPIHLHPEVQDFLRSVTAYIKKGKLVHAVYRKVRSKKLKNLAIYGPDWKNSKTGFGPEHCQFIGQGNPILKKTKKDNVYELTFTEHVGFSGDVSTFKGGLDVVLGATYRAGRGFEVDEKRYSGARIGIMPLSLIHRRSGATEI